VDVASVPPALPRLIGMGLADPAAKVWRATFSSPRS
jgi:hypothetical protein